MVFYRKYRPQTVSELDSKDLRQRLYSVLSSSSVSHAFLFAGPKGLGKTSTARIVAKAINCERRAPSKSASRKNQPVSGSNAKRYTLDASLEPCNECAQCVSITNGSNLDVLEIDGASNRGIDEIRDLREKIRLMPVSASKKIYIIDEVHMLTTDAFNALLKTLEEPPSHAMFIFCTTELHKVPQTILSRCFIITFKKATDEELVSSFLRIAKGENIEIDKDALSLIATLSDGSFRDGAKILEEVALASEGKKITKEFLEEKYHTSSISHYVEKIAGSLAQKDTKESIVAISELVAKGIDITYFIEQLISALHALLLAKVGIEQESKLPASTRGEQNLQFTIEDIKRLVKLLSKAYEELKHAVLPQLPLEIAVIEWGIGSSALGALLSDASQSVDQSVSYKKTDEQKTVRSETETQDLWGKLIDGIKIHNHSIAGVLRGCKLRDYQDNQIIIETSFQFHKNKLSEEKTLKILEQVGQEITGKKVTVLVELKGK